LYHADIHASSGRRKKARGCGIMWKWIGITATKGKWVVVTEEDIMYVRILSVRKLRDFVKTAWHLNERKAQKVAKMIWKLWKAKGFPTEFELKINLNAIR